MPVLVLGTQMTPSGGNRVPDPDWGIAAASARAVVYSWLISNCSQCPYKQQKGACAIRTLGQEKGHTDESEDLGVIHVGVWPSRGNPKLEDSECSRVKGR